MALDRSTRVGLGGTAFFTLAALATPFFGWELSGPVMGVCAVVAGWGFWPLIHSRLPSKQQIADYWNGHAKTHAVILGSLILGIGIGGIVSTGNYAPLVSAPDTGRIVWNFEETASGRGYFLNMQKPNGTEIRVVGFGAHGKNNSPEPINDFDAYLRSDTTNETIPIYIIAAESGAANVCTPFVPTLPKDTMGIAAFADFDIVSYDKIFALNLLYEGAMPLSKFLNQFAPFTIVMKYDGRNYQRHFSRAEVDKQVVLLEKVAGPITTPHIVRKPSAPVVHFPPLTTVHPPNNDVTGKIPEK